MSDQFAKMEERECPGCGVRIPITPGIPRTGASPACGAVYDELSGRTLVRRDTSFIHQHGVDAYTAQHLVDYGSSIRGAFALAGLCLTVERGFSGRQVQRAHTLMARWKRQWPRFSAPVGAGWMTVAEVVGSSDRVLPGALQEWCGSVWSAFEGEHERVFAMLIDTL